MIPLTVNAHDMIHKIFGIMDAAGSRADSLQRAALALSLYPVLEDSLLWLDSADGYRLSYSGMTPDVAAYARVAPDNSIDGYCYFFIFPHDSVPPVKVIPQEAQFAGTLLQELADMGLNPGADANTDFLFDVYADTPGKTVNVRLADCTLSESDSRYALMFAVTLQSPADAEIETPAR